MSPLPLPARTQAIFSSQPSHTIKAIFLLRIGKLFSPTSFRNLNTSMSLPSLNLITLESILIIRELRTELESFLLKVQRIIVITVRLMAPTLALPLGSNSIRPHVSNRIPLLYSLTAIANLPFLFRPKSSCQLNSPSAQPRVPSPSSAPASSSLTRANRYQARSRCTSSRTLARGVATLGGS